MADMLKQSADARKMAVSLKHLQYGDGLVDQLFAHSSEMEKLYVLVQERKSRGECIKQHAKLTAWWERAKVWWSSRLTQVMFD